MKKALAALLVAAALPACTAALHGHQSSGSGATSTTVASRVSAGASGSNSAVRASFGRPLSPSAPGAYLSVSTGNAAGVLLLGIVVVNVIDYLSGTPAGGVSAGSSANRPIAHTCSCYGYQPDDVTPTSGKYP